MASDGEPIYCLCRLPYDETQFMIECDVCKDWFHGGCVGIQEHQAADIEIYHCPNCSRKHGPLVLKKRKNWHRHDYSEDDPTASSAVQTGTSVFVRELKKRSFPNADEIPVKRLHGAQMTAHFLDENGFDTPVLCEKKDGLGLTLPPPSFTIRDVEELVGPMREIDVIDVSRQEDIKMIMREWTEYYNSTNRDKVLNVISLEFSDTRMSELVIPPSIVRQVSWARNIWPEQLPEDSGMGRPEVQKYCLMGVKDSFTDFHIDFGGTSVWYHILRGEKVFYFIRPTEKNLTLYEHWLSSSKQSETFFGDQVDECYRQVVRQGQTLFIPTGWIHAVLTPIDSLVFGGNFLHNYNIPLQLQCYDIERQVKTPDKYLFPNYETMNWYAAKYVLDLIKDYTEEKKPPPDYMASGARALLSNLKAWTQRKDYAKVGKQDVADYIQYGKLLKDLVKEIKVIDSLNPPTPKKTKRGNKKSDKDKTATSSSNNNNSTTTTTTTKTATRTTTSSTPVKKLTGLDMLEEHTKETLKASDMKHRESIYNFQDEEDEPLLSLKVRIPKAGAYQPDTTSGSINDSTAKREKENKEVKPNKELKRGSSVSSSKKQQEPASKRAKMEVKEEEEDIKKIKSEESSESSSPLKAVPQCLKFKLSNGKMVSTDRKSKAKKMKKKEFLLLGEDVKKEEEKEVKKVKKKSSAATKTEEKDAKSVKRKNKESSNKKSSSSLSSSPVKHKKPEPSPSSSSSLKDKQSSPSVPKKKKLKQSSSKLSNKKKTSSSSSSSSSHSKKEKTSSSSSSHSKKEKTSSSSSSHSKKEKSSSERRNKAGDSSSGKGEELSSPAAKTDKVHNSDDSDSESGQNLVVDMNPKKARGQKTSSTTKPASLKMRLPSDSQDKGEASDPARQGLDTIHGGLNGSISDILTASGYGTETAFKVDGDSTSGMRDAIAGMLTMSRMGQGGDAGDAAPGLFTAGGGGGGSGKGNMSAAEEEKQLMSDCYQDEEFVYPSFELSDEEDGASSPTKKTQGKDDNWNPKARVNSSIVKTDRDHREGKQKKSMVENLAATAAKLAEKPLKDKKGLKKSLNQKPKEPEVVREFEVQPLPGPSSSLDDEPVNAFRPGIKRPVDPCAIKDPANQSNKSKKPKKGLATAKQRLGKLLKIRKMVF